MIQRRICQKDSVVCTMAPLLCTFCRFAKKSSHRISGIISYSPGGLLVRFSALPTTAWGWVSHSRYLWGEGAGLILGSELWLKCQGETICVTGSAGLFNTAGICITLVIRSPWAQASEKRVGLGARPIKACTWADEVPRMQKDMGTLPPLSSNTMISTIRCPFLSYILLSFCIEAELVGFQLSLWMFIQPPF